MEKQINGICCKTVEKEADVYFDMALTMLEEIMAHNAKGEKTVMIVPVGPTDQYPILAELVNRLNVSLKNVHFFNMDEYMISDTEAVGHDDPLSFYGRMKREFYDRVREDLVMPESQRHFPAPGKEAEYDRLIEELGGVDACFGGLGINGHVAFNEPPEADAPMAADEFAALGTRVLPISRETKTINAFMNSGSDMDAIPDNCITVGMKEIFFARKVRMCMPRDWNAAMLRKALHGPVSCHVPVSLFQNHPDAMLYASAVATACPVAEIRVYNK